MIILQFSEHFQLIFDNLKLSNDKQKMAIFFFRIIKIFLLILLREATLGSKVAPTNRNSSAFLLHTSKIFSNVELFSIFSHFFGFHFRHQNNNNVVEAVLFTSWQKNIAYIMCLNTLNIVHK